MSERRKLKRNLAAGATAFILAATGASVERASAASSKVFPDEKIELVGKDPEVNPKAMVNLAMRPNPKFAGSELYGNPNWQIIGSGFKINIKGNNYVITDPSFLTAITGSHDGSIKKGEGFYKDVKDKVIDFRPEVMSRYQIGIDRAGEVDNEPMAIAEHILVPTNGLRT